MHLTPQEKIFNEIFPICEEQAMRGDYIHSPSGLATKNIAAICINMEKMGILKSTITNKKKIWKASI